jgi:hypothetical protein
MATVQPQTGEDRPPFCLTLGRRPGSDPRYRVLQRRDVREAVRIQLATVMAIVIGSMAIIGLHHSLVDGAALATLATSAVLLVDRRIVQRRPHATAVFSGIVLDLLIAATLIDVPDKTTLVIGAYGITIVSSTLFVAFDWRPHLMWLAVSLGVWLIAVPLAPIGDAARFQAVAVAAIALVTSAAGNRLVQKRRERTYATEATLRLEHRELRQTVARLEAAMKTIANLEGVLPICAHCKRIREGGHTWVRIETYVEQRSGAQFSHGICPECADRYFPGVLAEP